MDTPQIEHRKIWETERLVLRPLEPADLDTLHELYRDAVVMQYILGRPRSYEETRQRLAHHVADFEQHGFGLYAAILKSSGAMVGRCGLEPVSGAGGLQGELAWMFAPAVWGQGLASEFAPAMIRHGFARFPIVRMFATADHRNVASIRVMRTSGMTLVRTDQRGVEYEIWPPPRPTP
ncbi:MAG TPA: GNAT family N-acetyltransferase [Kofleriaceae bacterium]|jgi:RimJ/RimL family protein N-acetyltransferase|nr:GNAT family N-acetyltransferase [Kofleriaceae bacterium]